mgnify:CR=1 FL=1
MPRPRNHVRPHDWKLSIPRDLAADVDMRLWDPVLQKPKYGGRSGLVADLLRRWLHEQTDQEIAETIPAHSEGTFL